MYFLKIIEKREEWINILNKFKSIDYYYSFEYGNLFAKNENGSLLAAFYEGQESIIFYPFIKRKVPHIEDEHYDIVTPYGYGGPLMQGSKEIVSKFCELFSSYCRSNNIITETIRFHPLYRNHEVFINFLDVEYIRKTTAVDLTTTLEDIRRNYSSMNKRNIKKAKKNNLTCYIAEKSKENIDVFFNLYQETMDRNNADSYYYFTEKYFSEQAKDNEIGETILLFAKKNDEIVAAVIILVGKEYAHYHLGASKTKYLDLKPNNLLFDYMIEFCKSKGSKILHLGGGYQEHDGLFKFKASFTNRNHYQYYIGKKVHNVSQYEKVINSLKEQYQVNERYFPIYRGQLQKINMYI